MIDVGRRSLASMPCKIIEEIDCSLVFFSVDPVPNPLGQKFACLPGCGNVPTVEARLFSNHLANQRGLKAFRIQVDILLLVLVHMHLTSVDLVI